MAKKAQIKARLSIDNSLYMRGLRAAKQETKDFAKSAGETAKKGVEILTVATLALTAALAVGVEQAYSMGRELQQMSERTGIAVDQLMILRQAGKNNGIDDVSTAIKKMQVNLKDAIENGASPAARAFNALGLNAEELLKKTPIDQFRAIAGAINNIKDPTMRTAEAVAIFGREGSNMLSLFAKKNALGDAANQIGKQAAILKANAERFAAVSESISRVGLKLQGFFVGVAEQILPVIEIVTKQLDALDLSGIGEEVGKDLRAAVDYFVGAFQNPSAFFDSAILYLQAGVLEAGNLLAMGVHGVMAIFSSADVWEYGAKSLAGYGQILEGALLNAFNSGAAYFQAVMEAAWEKILEMVPESLGGHKSQAEKNQKQIEQLRLVIEHGTESVRNAQLGTGNFAGKSIELRQGFIKAAMPNLRAAQADMQRLNTQGNGQSIADRARELAAQGPLQGIASDLNKQGLEAIGKNAGPMLDAAFEALKGIKHEDVFGSGEWFERAKKAGEALRRAGAAITDSMSTPPNPIIQEATNQMTRFTSMNGGLSTGSLMTGSLSMGHLQGGAYAHPHLLKAAERRASENALVAQGLMNRDQRGTSAFAHHVVRSGDFKRARNVAVERERQYQKNQAANIAGIRNATEAMAKGWGFDAGGGAQ